MLEKLENVEKCTKLCEKRLKLCKGLKLCKLEKIVKEQEYKDVEARAA